MLRNYDYFKTTSSPC